MGKYSHAIGSDADHLDFGSPFYPAYYSALTQQLWFLLGQNLVEDVIVPLSLELIGDTRLLQQIYKRKKNVKVEQ